MIRKVLGKAKRFVTNDASATALDSKENKLLQKLVGSITTTRQINDKASRQLTKSDEVLFYIDKVKNGMTVKTDEHEALTRIFTGQKMYVDTRDISVAPHLMMDGQWEMGISKIFQKHVNEGDVVLDIGANFGYFGVIAGAQTKSSGKVILVEANKLLVPYIEKSLSVNGLNGFSKVEHVAIGDKEGTLKLNVLDGYMGSSTVLKSSNATLKEFNTSLDHTETVRSTSIDILCKENKISAVNVIKIDIEGYEDVAYDGMKNTIKNSPDLKMFLEFTGSAYKKPAEFYKKIARDFEYIYAIDEDSNLTQVANYKQLDELAAGDWIMILLSKEQI